MPKKDDTPTYYSYIKIHWNTKVREMPPYELTGRWTYKTVDKCAILFERMDIDMSKPSVGIKRLLVPLYNVLRVEEREIEEIIDDIIDKEMDKDD
jgi:hypothetical protein